MLPNSRPDASEPPVGGPSARDVRFRGALSRLVRRQDLSREDAAAVMTDIMDGVLAPSQMGAFLAALAGKGETVDELVGLAEVMRRRAQPVHVPAAIADRVIDTCGTGGSGQTTLNTSTLVAFVVAAAGIPVAKHGNRASSGKCGSIDVLEHLGMPVALASERVAETIEALGIGFMFAPLFHPGLRHVGPVRRELGIRTTFNFLGPLANPAGARRQLLGVSDPERAPRMLDALRALGSTHVIVVHGADGLDEITTTGDTRVWMLKGGQVKETVIVPKDLGLHAASAEEVSGGEVHENAELFVAVLKNEAPAPLLDLVALNAAAAFVVAEEADDWAAGLARARKILATQKAHRLFERYREMASVIVHRGGASEGRGGAQP
ncbi:MAG: anthranilate phosphoribosyltransferase [Deltaproteobacteria bacterium]|nr:anthranilate phosphoribosyltransferase [Deltaproteobacteria bacterium]